MASWDSLANKLKTLKDFSKKDTFSGKSAQARFNTLVASHRKFDRKSEGAWGIDQRYAEKRQLLDDLVSQFDEHERDEGRCIRERKDKLAAEENAGKVMRDAGLKRMKERKKKARTKLMRTKADREEKAKQWEADNADKYKQWQEEREDTKQSLAQLQAQSHSSPGHSCRGCPSPDQRQLFYGRDSSRHRYQASRGGSDHFLED
ncbi:hypothetical protein F442_05667 [Phytophthora nicotianae P10297]|uniref:Uncharacterized protein n=1 Tax=Phytophthora nicotianae P10297 TaxID=1317064 RepID=W2ZQZ7_PHYNI|nr:hypothetical protein F442_05667 [Phytophthora nicotianae P10297]